MAEDQPQPFYTPLAEADEAKAQQDGATASAVTATQPARTPEKPSQTPHFSQDAASHPIVTQFTQKYHSAISNAKSGKDEDARRDYSEMLKLYSVLITIPDMHDMNRDIAHFCLQDVYDAISKNSDPVVSKLSFGALIGITMLLLVIGGMIATNPSIVGLVTGLAVRGHPGPQWVGGETAVVITGPTTLHLAPLFLAKDGSEMTYLATSSGTLDAVVAGEYATLVPKYGAIGTTRIELIAALSKDPNAMTRVPVDVTVVAK